MKTHNLKTWSEYFRDICKGFKTFEIRKNDRKFEIGDILNLEEYDPNEQKYSGRSVYCEIVYMLNGKEEFGISKDYCILGIKVISNKEYIERNTI